MSYYNYTALLSFWLWEKRRTRIHFRLYKHEFLEKISSVFVAFRTTKWIQENLLVYFGREAAHAIGQKTRIATVGIVEACFDGSSGIVKFQHDTAAGWDGSFEILDVFAAPTKGPSKGSRIRIIPKGNTKAFVQGTGGNDGIDGDGGVSCEWRGVRGGFGPWKGGWWKTMTTSQIPLLLQRILLEESPQCTTRDLVLEGCYDRATRIDRRRWQFGWGIAFLLLGGL